MSEQVDAIPSDDELLAIARQIFVEEEFALEKIDGEVSFILAENAYFLVGVVATPTIAQLLVAEGAAESAISQRLSASDVGPKRWDAYLVLLTQERSPESGHVTQGLYEINYDTARLRRIAHAGVDPTAESVRAVLAPFIPPTESSDPLITQNPFQLMVSALASHGVERNFAQRAVNAFEQGVSLGDVL